MNDEGAKEGVRGHDRDNSEKEDNKYTTNMMESLMKKQHLAQKTEQNLAEC